MLNPRESPYYLRSRTRVSYLHKLCLTANKGSATGGQSEGADKEHRSPKQGERYPGQGNGESGHVRKQKKSMGPMAVSQMGVGSREQ